MKFVLYTNALSEHQMPLAREIVKRIGAENFRYIYTGSSSQKFQESRASEDWIVCAEDHQWLEEADVVLIGGIRPIELMELRASRGLLTFYQSERWFKPFHGLPGWLRMLVPSYRRMAKRFVRLVNENPCVKFLAKGPWARKDFLRLGVKTDKIVDWGYFVSAGVEKRCRYRKAGDPLRVLWVGRELSWKRVRDIERAVNLANRKLLSVVRASAPNLPPISFTKLTGISMSEVRVAMRIHDVYVLASDSNEGWGAALNEALEEGMNAIGTFEAGASASMLPVERLYHAGNVRALAELLEKEYEDKLGTCSIGNWTAVCAAERLMARIGL